MGEEALLLERKHEVEVKLCKGDICDGEAGFGDVL